MLEKEEFLQLSYGSYRIFDMDRVQNRNGTYDYFLSFQHTKRKKQPITTILREDRSGFRFEVYYKEQHIPQTVIKKIQHFIENHPSYRLAFLLKNKTFQTIIRNMEEELEKERNLCY